MNRNTALVGTVLVAGITLAVAPAASAGGGPAPRSLTANLSPLNDSGASGTARVGVTGNKLAVDLHVTGLLADHPHAAHIHYGEQARNECPTLARDDTNGDGMLATLEGEPAYGPIVVSLTTSGDTSPASGLAVSRFSTAPGGVLDYFRTIKTSRDTAKDVQDREAVVVVHGVDHNGNGTYDFGAGVSDLTPGEAGEPGVLPAEATDPAACGVIR